MAWFHAVVGGAGMRYIMMVLRGNMRRNKGVHISVFVLMLIISLAFCSVLSYYTNSIRHDSEAMEEVGYGGMLAALYGENRLQRSLFMSTMSSVHGASSLRADRR